MENGKFAAVTTMADGHMSHRERASSSSLRREVCAGVRDNQSLDRSTLDQTLTHSQNSFKADSAINLRISSS